MSILRQRETTESKYQATTAENTNDIDELFNRAAQQIAETSRLVSALANSVNKNSHIPSQVKNVRIDTKKRKKD